MKLLRFPYLVQKEILQAMYLYEAFALSTVSEKSRRLVRRCLSHQQFQIVYHIESHIRIRRESEDTEKHGILFDFRNHRHLCKDYPYQYWRLLDECDIPVKIEFIINVPIVYSYWRADERKQAIKMYKYVLDLFPKYSVNLEFQRLDDERTLVSTMELANVEEVKAGYYHHEDDDLVRTALTRCGNVKKLFVESRVSTDFRFNFRQLASFTLEHLTIEHSHWVTKNHLLPLFINCKEVIMKRAGAVENEDLAALLDKWMKGSRMEHFELDGNVWHDHRAIGQALAGLPDAVQVLKAKIWTKSGEKDYEFEAGQCYMIQKTDGKRAVVFRTRYRVVFTTRFEIKKAVEQQMLKRI